MIDAPRPIIIDIREVRPGATGVGRAVEHLVRAAVAQAPRWRFVLLHHDPPAVQARFHFANVDWLRAPHSPQRHPRADLWLALRLPRLIERLDAALYHGPAFIVPPRRMAAPSVVTVHDLSAFERHGANRAAFGLYLRAMIRRGVRVAQRVVAVSETVRADLRRRFALPAERVVAIPNALAPEVAKPSDEAITAFYHSQGLSRPCIASVGTLEPRKNPLMLAEAMARLPRETRPLLVWAGAEGYKSRALFQAMRGRLGEHGVRWMRGLDDGQLHCLMAGAQVVACPSRAEGFGLTLLEAMALETPVVCSGIAAHREVAGQAALFAAADDPGDFARRIQSVLNDAQLRAALIEKGRERCRAWCWEESARKLIDLYSTIMRK